MNDFALLELEGSAGGNSRAGSVNGIACPLGAHYLPVPNASASHVQDLLEELATRCQAPGDNANALAVLWQLQARCVQTLAMARPLFVEIGRELARLQAAVSDNTGAGLTQA